jgi:hypothetical protein
MRKRHPYLTKEFWDNEKNHYWKNDFHNNQEYYEDTLKRIQESFRVKDDYINRNQI